MFTVNFCAFCVHVLMVIVTLVISIAVHSLALNDMSEMTVCLSVKLNTVPTVGYVLQR